MGVDPLLDRHFDLIEVAHHPFPIQPLGGELDCHLAIVSVEILALALVVQEPMAVAEVDGACDPVHAPS